MAWHVTYRLRRASTASSRPVGTSRCGACKSSCARHRRQRAPWTTARPRASRPRLPRPSHTRPTTRQPSARAQIALSQGSARAEAHGTSQVQVVTGEVAAQRQAMASPDAARSFLLRNGVPHAGGSDGFTLPCVRRSLYWPMTWIQRCGGARAKRRGGARKQPECARAWVVRCRSARALAVRAVRVFSHASRRERVACRCLAPRGLSASAAHGWSSQGRRGAHRTCARRGRR
jgi:hypothetical protein